MNDKSKYGLTLNILKFIAIIIMAITHYSYLFFSVGTINFTLFAVLIGHIAGVIMFYSAVEGYHHTRNIKKYLIRLLILTIISQPFYVYWTEGGVLTSDDILSYFLLRINVIFLIFLGILATHIRREIKNRFFKIFLIICVFIVSMFVEWGTMGILIFFIFDYFYGSLRKQLIFYCILISLTHLLSFFQLGLNMFAFDHFAGILAPYLPIILLCFYNGQKGKGGAFSKWFFYIFYPLHLFVLGFLHAILSR